ncbi:MAG: hypothetical protein KIS94_09940, partial [Chitinophagales bacterium]|nr:hypothetical protein [Chitinophagales bacterium]
MKNYSPSQFYLNSYLTATHKTFLKQFKKRLFVWLLAACSIFSFQNNGLYAQQVLHHFDYNNDGGYPNGDLVSDGTWLYGTTNSGGSYGYGTIFKVKTDGSNFTILRSLDGLGANPAGRLVLNGAYLYGMATDGGIYGFGAIFRVDTINGSGYTTLFDFDYSNGASPNGGLYTDGNRLYGMTKYGGNNGSGLIFKMNPDGTGFTVLHYFDSSNGINPEGGLISDGTYLYGTALGGNNGAGVVFRIDTVDGSNFIKLYDFVSVNGSNPCGSLILGGTWLFGMTTFGGINNNGVVFKIKTDGTNFNKLLDFDLNNGRYPNGSLVTDGTWLYGMTEHDGGGGVSGVLFKLKQDGSSYNKLINFTGANGQNPRGGLTMISNTCPILYGMTKYGGTYSKGIIFKYNALNSVNTITSCQNPFTWIDGNNYTSSNNTASYTYIGGSVNGCDSTVFLNLTLLRSSTKPQFNVSGTSYLCNLGDKLQLNLIVQPQNKFTYGQAPYPPTVNTSEVACNCPPGYVATGYQGRSGAWIDQFSLRCRELIAGNTLGVTTVVTNSNGVSNGGAPRGPFEFTGDTVLVGLIVYKNGTYLNGVQAIAQPLSVVLANGNNRLNPIYLPVVGNTSDAVCNPDTLFLDNGTFMSGMMKWSDANNYAAAVGLNSYGYSSYTPTRDLCNEQYLWNNGSTTRDITLTAAGSYVLTVTHNSGCTTLSDTFNVATGLGFTTIDTTVCDSYSFKGITLTKSGTYRDTLTNVVGCDSLVILNLTVKRSSSDYTCAGTTWSEVAAPVNLTYNEVAFGNGIFVAVASSGTGNRVMTSTDGETWTSRSSAADNTWNSVAYGNGMFVAVASTGTGNRVMTSPDGITWTSRTSAADNSWNSVVYGDSLFVAVSSTGTGNRVMTSPDGITWTSRSSAADNTWNSVAYGNGVFVAVASSSIGNRVMTSPDGITWTIRTSAANNIWNSVAYGNGLFVAVSSTGTGNRVMTSPDGITWTIRTSAANNTWNSVTYGKGVFVAVSSSGIGNRVMTSPDGITWTSQTSAADNAWNSVAYGNGMFVAVASGGTNRVMISKCQPAPIYDVITACNSYTWINGVTYTASNNTATYTLTNQAGCDSVVTLNLTINNNTGVQTVTACDSYTWIDGNTYTSSNNSATFTLTNQAGCDSVVTLNLTINHSNTGTDVITACDSYTWIDGNTYTSSNNSATFTLTNQAGCDSVVTLNLTINHSNTGTDVITACDSYTWIDGNTYTSSNNTATFILTNQAGCDSVVTLNLTINHSNTETDVITACDSYTWIDGNTYTSSNNTATFTLTNQAGCDSVVTLNLTINHSNTGTDVITACDSYTWIDGNTYTSGNNTATFTLTNQAGCDSVVTLHLTINHSNTGTDVITACDSYVWIDGNTYTSSSNTATFTLTNQAGCDSVVTLNLTINHSNTGTDVITACDSYVWIDGNAYTSSNNTATFTLTNQAGCDSVVTLNLTINHSNSGTDVITACDSYTWIDGNIYTASNNSATFTLTNQAGCDSVVTLNLTINHSNTGTDVVTACDSYVWIDGNTYTSSNNTATFTLTNQSGCDSVVTLHLTINHSNTGIDVITACDSYVWIDGNTYTSSNNTAMFTLTNQAGCDSVVTLNLTINHSNTGTDVITACDSYVWIDGNTYTSSNNTATFTLTNQAGCDSVITLNLTINHSNTGTDVITACDSYVWIDGNTYTSSNNTATFTLTNQAGCDSVVTLNLTINHSNTGTDVITACDSYVWIDGNAYTSSNNTATFTLTNQAGCDSVVTLNLTINHSNTGTDVITACDSYTWIDGNTYTSSNNTATFTLTNQAGCDSVVTLNLTINHSNTGTDVITACDSYTWIDGITYTANNNTATVTLTNQAGCDSVVTLNLTINHSNTGTDVITACDSYTWIDGNTYTSSNNSATFTLTNQAGCDSVVTLNLTINHSNTGTDVITACDGYTWIDGNTYTASNNTATFTLTNQAGCDSVVTLNLTINHSNTGTDVITACDSYVWIDGNAYTSSNNTATFTLTNQAGCDSMVTLNLTINHSNTGTDVITACDSYTWIDGITYTSSNNTATFTLTNQAGCDSMVTLNLTINHSNTGTDVVTACDSYTWIDGNTYTANNNTATVTLTNQAGCDSVVTLNLTINHSNTGTDVITACDGYTWIDGNTYTASNNTATFTLTNQAGCDSVVTLNLTIKHSNTGTDVITACDSYTWIDGNTYTASNNTATFTLTNQAGCDSVVTLNLTI